MKKIVYFATIALVIFGLAACEEEEILREESPAANPNSTNVYFDSLNTTNIVLPLDISTIKILVGRKITDASQTVAIEYDHAYDESLFDIPTSVTFDAGANTAELDITLGEIELMKKYHIALAIEYDQTNPYADTALKVFPRIELNITQEDFAPYADGTYETTFFEASWDQILEYSPIAELYRFNDLWGFGENVLFEWDGADEIRMIGEEEGDEVGIITGYEHPDYGMVTAWYSNVTYDANTKTFTFPIEWTVSAGTFGVYPATYTITSLY